MKDPRGKQKTLRGERETEHSLLGRVLNNRYLLKAPLNQGGMGTVFSGWDLAEKREIVVKTLNVSPAALSANTTVQRFRREARGMSRFNHPNIVRIFDSGFDSGSLPFIVMEFLEGETLKEILKHYPDGLPFDLFFTFMKQLCSVFALIHDNGVLHRDLKPRNVMVCQRGPEFVLKVLDLGLVQFEGLEDTTFKRRITERGALVGTPNYMSPEQCMGQSVTHRSDLYSLGLMAYEMLLGHSPFKGIQLRPLLMKQVTEMPAALHVLRPEVSPTLSRVIEKAIQKEPCDRYENARTFWTALENALGTRNE